ncbi:glycosyltransferase [Mesobacterium pallidum]|uniref:glycosyltransferase n=1 Tax=Mesobacterium pallidum TaxID=2872037 RepID=UPI001EE30C96|nr:glycosyltransferase [Mesobacterium pallidum]
MKYMTISLYHPRVMKGGAQYVAKDLHDAADADPDVEAVLLAGIDGHMFPQYGKVGSSITALPDSSREFILPGQTFNEFYHTVYDQRRTKALQRFFSDHKPDVIHVHHSLWVGLEILEIAKQVLPNVKIIYTLHEYLPICYSRGQLFRYHENGICQDTSPDQCVKCFPDKTADDFILRRRVFKRAFKFVDHFVSPSEYLRQRFIQWGLPEDDISVIANGHASMRPANWIPRHSANVNVFGFFGQFVDAKGIDVLLAAASQAAADMDESEEIEIRIFGGNKAYASEDYTKRIDAILDNAPKNLTIKEMGSYSRDNVFQLMSSIDWLVMPSIWPETFGLVVSEAWDARRPILSSQAGGLLDRTTDGVNGFTFAPGSMSQLSTLIKECRGNKPLWEKLSAGVRDEISLTEAWGRHKEIVERLLV